MTHQISKALVIGAGRGTGRALALKLADAGICVTAVARTASDLEKLKAENNDIDVIVGDGSNDIAHGLIADIQPDLLLLAGGVSPKMGSFFDQDWESFSSAWNGDTKTTFEFLKAAITAPMARDSAIVTFASGAAINGSWLSGGYAGAKRMQHYLTNYTSKESDRRDLGLRCFTVYPLQLIAGTNTGETAIKAYADAQGVSVAEFRTQWKTQLTPDILAEKALELVDHQSEYAPGAWGITGSNLEPMS
jgi:NAD(P)-dependent dehydrogenase (short-subunit alcohol dehydrogenase family)